MTFALAIPCRTRRWPGQHRAFTRRAPRALSPRRAPNTTRFQSPRCLPPMSPVARRPSLSRTSRPTDRHGCLPVSRRPHFRHAFTRSHYALGPLACPAIRWSSRATCRPSTSATEMIHEHTNAGASSAVWIVRASPATSFPNRQTEPAPADDPEPLSGTCQPGCLRPGVPVSLRIDLWTPTQRPLATVDLPQPDRPGHPLSRADVRRLMEQLAPNDRAVIGLPYAFRHELRRALSGNSAHPMRHACARRTC
jgi:hypothetical protein